jgi:hypothetical protein
MKTKIASMIAVMLISGVAGFSSPVPLSVLIVEENERIADEVRAFNKQCSHADSFSGGSCMDKRYALSGELGKFVALVNDELEFLGRPSRWPE